MSRSVLHFALVATLAAGAACSGDNNVVPSNPGNSSSSSGGGGSDSSSSGGDDSSGGSSSGGDDSGGASSSGGDDAGGASSSSSASSGGSSSGGSGSSNGGVSSGSGAGASSGISSGSSSGSNSGSSSGSGSGSGGSRTDDGGSDAQSDSAGVADAARGDGGPLSFATDVYPILTDRCIACHTPGGSGVVNGHLDYTTNLASGAYSQLMMKAMGNLAGTAAVTCMASGLTRVVPRSSATSLLYNKVNSKLNGAPPLCGNAMPNPAAAPPLTADEVATIRMWIDQGANP